MSNSVPFVFVWENAQTVYFLETGEFYEVKVGTYSQINEYMTIYDYPRSMPFIDFVQGHLDSTFSNFFSSETARRIEAFPMEPPWDVGSETLFKCSRSHDHTHIW